MSKQEEIRKRIWYKRWDDLYKNLGNGNSMEWKMRYVKAMIDGINGFRSIKASGYARESLEQLLKDKEELFDAI